MLNNFQLNRLFRCDAFAGGRETEKDGDGGQGRLIKRKKIKNYEKIEIEGNDRLWQGILIDRTDLHGGKRV